MLWEQQKKNSQKLASRELGQIDKEVHHNSSVLMLDSGMNGALWKYTAAQHAYFCLKISE